jgi:UDP-2,3-diacylglucosamine pyrophosphatase LpxH
MPGKFKIVISDLHLSAGRELEGNRLEDFGSDQEFSAFMDELVAESERDGAEVELIVNGDAFEMLQVPHVDEFDPVVVYAPGQYHSSSEDDSARKMAIIIDGHRPFFEALGRFIRIGPPRRSVTFVKGNHDLNLYWVAVQELIREAMGATGGRKSLLSFEALCVNREGIYVEHGNQYAEAVDQVDDMEDPRDPDRPDQLDLPLGSWFVMDVFNQVERERYWIDGVKPITALVWYALAYDFAFAARAIATLARSLPNILDQAVFSLEEPPEGVLIHPLEGQTMAEPLAQQLEDPVRVGAMAEQYETDPAFRASFNAELERILMHEPVLGDTPSFALATDSDPAVKGDSVRARVNSSLFESAVELAQEHGVKLVTFGHTHDAGLERLPNGGVYVNSGTWTWRADLGDKGKETWRELFDHPERFTDDRQLNFVRIDYDEAGDPVGRLMVYVSEVELLSGPLPDISSLWQRIVGWFQQLWESITDGG